jgi:hypothetical protein
LFHSSIELNYLRAEVRQLVRFNLVSSSFARHSEPLSCYWIIANPLGLASWRS